MKLQVFGCSHHQSSIETRERLAFSSDQTREALSVLRERYADTEAVLLSTCNRMELYLAAEPNRDLPSRRDVADFLAEFHRLEPARVHDALFERDGKDAARHLFTVAASLDSMVVGEAQILSQVKRAYREATEGGTAGPMTHSAFQGANHVAKRVARETSIHKKQVSIPSVAVADFAKQLFERFDDKKVLVVGAGEMGEETLRYLIKEGARDITMVNRSQPRSVELANRLAGRAAPWGDLRELLVTTDLVVSTTGSKDPIVSEQEFKSIHRQRAERPLFVLDLAVPRDFDAAIGRLPGVYLYSIDDLKRTCEGNRRAREKEWPKAERIVEDETSRFWARLGRRAAASTIRGLKAQADAIKTDELRRLLNKLGDVDKRSRTEIQCAFDRVINKFLHPPLERLSHEAAGGSSNMMLDAVRRLYQIQQ